MIKALTGQLVQLSEGQRSTYGRKTLIEMLSMPHTSEHDLNRSAQRGQRHNVPESHLNHAVIDTHTL
jgi:hypothetical protein